MVQLRARFASVLQGSFLRATLVLVSGTAVAQLVALAALPFITRLYTPEDFAVFAVFVAVVQFVSVIACLRLELAIPLPEDDADAMNLLALSLGFALITTLLAALYVYFLPGQLSRLLGQAQIEPLLWLVPPTILAAAVYSATQFWATRRKHFSAISGTRLVQALAGAGTQVGAGLAGLVPGGLLLGHAVQSGSGIVTLSRKIYSEDRETIRLISPARMRSQWNRYINFPKYSVADALAQIANAQIPIIVIAAVAAGPEAGYLVLAARVLQAPMSMIGAAVAQVFSSHASQAQRDRELSSITMRSVSGMVKLGAGPITFLAIVAPELFSLLFGSEWRRAGELARWLAPGIMLQVLASAIGSTFFVMDRQRRALGIQLMGAAIRIGSVVGAAAWASGSLVEAYAIAGAVFYSIYLIEGMRVADVSFSALSSELVKALPYSLPWIVLGAAVVAIT